jgi:serine/threonine protein phosphatase 1
MSSRLIAIGDVHGCSAALACLVGAIDPGPDDVIVTLGDYVDRGPDARGVLDQLIALRERCMLVPLLGNHEEMLLEALEDPLFRCEWWYLGGADTCASYGGKLSAIPQAHIKFLSDCRDYHETDTHFFAHACYLPDVPLDEQPHAVLRWRSLRDGLPGPHVSGKVAIVGHTSQKSGAILDAGHLLCIDTYCFGGGWLTALDVGSGEIWQSDEFGNRRHARPDIERVSAGPS